MYVIRLNDKYLLYKSCGLRQWIPDKVRATKFKKPPTRVIAEIEKGAYYEAS